MGGTLIPKRRSALDIRAAILIFCNIPDGRRITAIVHRTNMNFNSIRPHINFLLKKGFLRKKEEIDRVIYQTTNEAVPLLDDINKMKRELD